MPINLPINYRTENLTSPIKHRNIGTMKAQPSLCISYLTAKNHMIFWKSHMMISCENRLIVRDVLPDPIFSGTGTCTVMFTYAHTEVCSARVTSLLLLLLLLRTHWLASNVGTVATSH